MTVTFSHSHAVTRSLYLIRHWALTNSRFKQHISRANKHQQRICHFCKYCSVWFYENYDPKQVTLRELELFASHLWTLSKTLLFLVKNCEKQLQSTVQSLAETRTPVARLASRGTILLRQPLCLRPSQRRGRDPPTGWYGWNQVFMFPC